jgi:hypothetical protein
VRTEVDQTAAYQTKRALARWFLSSDADSIADQGCFDDYAWAKAKCDTRPRSLPAPKAIKQEENGG